MITIRIRPKRYSRAALQKEFKQFSESEDDFNEWLTAMQVTGQLEERKGFFVPSKAPKVDEKAVTDYRTFGTIIYRGKKEAEAPEIGIHEVWEEKRRNYPTEMQLLSFRNPKGRWKDIPKNDRPKFTFSKGRERKDKEGNIIKVGEKWRANLPHEITKRYGIKYGAEVYVKIGAVSKTYFQTLKLWGFASEAMISFGETSQRVNIRDLELHGWEFPFETKGPILSELTKVGTASIEVMSSWLATVDMDYANLLKNCREAGTTTETAPPLKIEGEALYRPFMSPPTKKAMIQLLDHDAKTVPTNRYTVFGKLPGNWHELDSDEMAMLFEFAKPSDDKVGHAKGYHGRKKDYRKLRTKQITLDQLKEGKEGEGFK